MENRKVLKSGEFLVSEVEPKDIFIPEEYDEEQLMIAQTCKDFLETEVYPDLDNLDLGNRELMLKKLKSSGELGLMGISIPEEFGGFGQSFVTQMLAAETIGAAHSFSVAFMAHCGIGTLPIMYFGSYEQREKYVTKLATGELIGAYCLTEPGAGSDANSGKTGASLSEDEKYYILNGQKMWITNAGFADIQIVFAKVDNDRVLSAFIVERDMEGVVVGPDEHKMGIKGSSTAQIYYNDVKVPVENMIGKRGEGFRIALSILHMGRLKLGANVLGAAKKAIIDSVQYANERKQFGTKIANFGAIKFKLADQLIRTFAAESATYRVSKDIDDLMAKYKTEGCDIGRAAIDAIAHYAVEAALLKVYGSEMLDYVADEAVQIHGGMGYSAEMDVERGYRDSRINRIFEGTNEINRLLVVDTAMKRAMKGDFDLFGEAQKLATDLDSLKAEIATSDDFFDQKISYIRNFKKIALLAINAASAEFGKKLVHEQEILFNISNIMMEIYVAESMALRVKKIEQLKGSADLYSDILDVYIYDAAAKINKAARDAFNSLTETENADAYLARTDELTVVAPVNVKDARRRLADRIIEDNTYKF